MELQGLMARAGLDLSSKCEVVGRAPDHLDVVRFESVLLLTHVLAMQHLYELCLGVRWLHLRFKPMASKSMKDQIYEGRWVKRPCHAPRCSAQGLPALPTVLDSAI